MVIILVCMDEGDPNLNYAGKQRLFVLVYIVMGGNHPRPLDV